jgi:hypothetical protein
MIERKTTVYDEHEMMQAYGDFYAVSSKACFNADDVPQELHPLVPYAEFWGIADDLQRENLIQAAPSQIASNLKSVVAEFDDHLDLWLHFAASVFFHAFGAPGSVSARMRRMWLRSLSPR